MLLAATDHRHRTLACEPARCRSPGERPLGWHPGWARVMKGAISEVGSVFTSHRMMRRYAVEAYLSCAG